MGLSSPVSLYWRLESRQNRQTRMSAPRLNSYRATKGKENMLSTIYRPWIALGSSAILAGLLVWLLTHQTANERSVAHPRPLVVYCAAGIRTPVEAVARQFEQECGVPIQLRYGSSQTLLANLSIAQRGDLYLPGDTSYLVLAQKKGLVAETLSLARMSLVLAVRKGNPEGIRSLEDLQRQDVTMAQADPAATAVGKLAREALEKSSLWEAVKKRTAVFKPTVNEVANDLKLGAVDAGLVWDITVRQYAELEVVPVPLFKGAQAHLGIGVLRCSDQPRSALRFARFLAARDRGQLEFARQGYELSEGDRWTLTPEMVLYSGAMNRVAVEDTIRQFEEREGMRVTRIYNGCGILVAQMKAGGRPDAYLTCDKSFVLPVADLFPDPLVELSDSAIVILVAKGNPKGIQSLADLVKPGLRLGVANPEQSTLGALTRRLLEQGKILEAVMANVVTQTPTADLLVNQMRTGALDGVVVYISNTTQARDYLDVIPLNLPGSVAIQTFSIAPNSKHKQLAGRLLQALRSDESRARYETAGFHWRTDESKRP